VHVERRQGLPLHELVRYPKYVSIEVIDFCNARCVMCGVDPDRRSRQKLPPEIFDKLLGELAENAEHVRWVSLGGNGEALADSGLEDKVARLKQAGIRRVHVTTNASLLTEARAEGLLRAGIDYVGISLDSLDKATFEAIRIGLNFDDVYRNLRNFIWARDALRPETQIRIQMVAQDLNAGEQEDFMRHWTEHLMSHDQVVIQRVFGWGRIRDLEPRSAAANAIPCITLWGSMDIYADGKVHMCCNDTNGDIVVGDTRTHSLAEIWQGPEMTRIRELHLNHQRHTIELCDGCMTWNENKHATDGTGTKQS
jgi:MoaA/NifB/PqqE/SkfB family radical SAM enzyme